MELQTLRMTGLAGEVLSAVLAARLATVLLRECAVTARPAELPAALTPSLTRLDTLVADVEAALNRAALTPSLTRLDTLVADAEAALNRAALDAAAL
jgi:hypothetical protein